MMWVWKSEHLWKDHLKDRKERLSLTACISAMMKCYFHKRKHALPRMMERFWLTNKHQTSETAKTPYLMKIKVKGQCRGGQKGGRGGWNHFTQQKAYTTPICLVTFTFAFQLQSVHIRFVGTWKQVWSNQRNMHTVFTKIPWNCSLS